MSLRTTLLTLTGLAFIAAGLGVVIIAPTLSGGLLVDLLLGFLALCALLLALWNVRGTLDGETGSVPWADDTFATPAPERTTRTEQLSAHSLQSLVAEAGRQARRGSLEDGVALVRSELRTLATDALGQSGQQPDDIEQMLRSGAWTDDRLAASVLDPAIEPPSRSRLTRFREWLYPERAIRRRTRHAMQAIGELTATDVASIPGGRAPRQIPVLEPRLEDLQVTADGSLQEAMNPAATRVGPQPIEPEFVADDSPENDNTDADTDTPDAETAGEETATADAGNKTATIDTGTDTGRDPPPEPLAVSRQKRPSRAAIGATVALAAAGLVDQNPILLLGATLPLAFVIVDGLSSPTVPAGLTLSRQVTPTPAPPGTVITVTLSLTNGSSRTLSDVRLADRVPADLAVLRESPRAGGSLEPGAQLSVEYLLVARRGEHTFDPPDIRLRSLGGGATATVTLSVAGDNQLACRLDATAPPIDDEGTTRIGQLETDSAGEGVSFHSIREYQPDDPATRVDWRHYAKRGTLATINYERAVSASVVIVIDATAASRVVAGRGQPTAVELAAYAGTQALDDLLGTGHDIGVAIVGRNGPGPAGLHWLEPGSGSRQRTQALEYLRLAAATAVEDETVAIDDQLGHLQALLPAGGQLAFFSPLLSDASLSAVEWWRGAGVPVTVFSPDVVPSNTVSGQYSQTHRRIRLAQAQAAGARTFDWRRGTPLPLAIQRAFTADVRRGASPSSGLAVETDGGPTHADNGGGR